MAGPQQSSSGYYASAATPSPPTLDTNFRAPPLSSPPSSSPSIPRFPPPPVIHPSQIPSLSMKTPNLPSPANGIRAGSPVPHMSTPPGPPVFSSPLQPAAVPFRTSPATPLPIAYSSGSSLPTSSPPLHFSNGSVELQHQLTEELDTAAESPNVLFSAHKVLKQKKLANVPSLGFGALVSPGRDVSLGPQIIQRDPHRCQNCGAYANLYCNILLGSGSGNA
ncbi:protein transport protein sec23 [Striga asiatica]|uniref:Protein transport protein sec23 n=1 Tax=Striga asiatica TaxID=4170 RepID=A0A5A7QER9_STRAF|nr:protein transport protein sec23 [Striga asiatica]